MKPPPNASTANRADNLATMGRPRGESAGRRAGLDFGSTAPEREQ